MTTDPGPDVTGGPSFPRSPVTVPPAETADEAPSGSPEPGGADPEQDASTTRVAALAGCSYAKVLRWVGDGHLRPEGNGGSGNPYSWPDEEVEVAVRMGRLDRAGLPLEWSAEFARSGEASAEIAPGIVVTMTEPP